ncbi:MAG: ankyrin repeat domain-containing protein [Candidatus Polarisedimenticolaceae bacterium]|nr:ankyrin repeat domain-containing protein [Candidatus Polarisedimenticolaceae bacterium]
MNPIKIPALILLLFLSACGEPDRPSLALYPAIERGDIAQIERHIKWGADLNQTNPDGSTPLHVAAKAGRWVVVKLLLKHGADINILDGEGHTPLYNAVMAGRTQVAEMLIKHGAKLDSNQLLQEAVSNQIVDRDIFRFLIQQGADINLITEEGETLLHTAVKKGYRVVSRILIRNGADINARDTAGQTPLWYAIQHKNSDIIALLKRNGAVAE